MDRRDSIATFGTGPLKLVDLCDEDDDGPKGPSRMAFVLDTIDYDEKDLEGVVVDSEGRLHVPFTWGVCGTCNGEGKHVNAAIDAHGISAEEWERDWDPDERDGYLNGDYDVPCVECHGRTTVPTPNLDALPPAARKLVDEALESHHDGCAIQAAEMRMGA